MAGQGRDHECLAEWLGHARHFLGGHFHDRREREEELAIGEWMLGAVTQYDRRQQVGAAIVLHEARPLPELRGDFARTRSIQPDVDLERDPLGDFGIRERSQRRIWIVGRARHDLHQLLRQRLRDRFRL